MDGRWMRAVVVVFAVGCGYSEGKFKDDYLDAYCGMSESCAEGTGVSISFGSADECKTFLGAFFSLGTAGCDYDPVAAKDCVDELGAASCDGLATGDGTPSCDAVYSGDACGWASTGSTPTTP